MSHSSYKKIIIVHGEKPLSNGNPNPEFIRRLELAIKLASDGEKIDLIIVTGGKTVVYSKPEAQFGKNYLEKRITIQVLAEDKSLTTIENIKFVKNILINNELEHIIVISSKKRLFRIRYLYKRLWPEMSSKIEFYGAADSYPLYFYILEFISLIYLMLDINEYFIPKIGKKIFRNG